MRLIDADKLLDEMCDYCNQEACEGNRHGSTEECQTIGYVRNVIDDQPTAYDVDKVIEELKNMQKHHKVLAKYERQVGTIVEMREHEYAIEVLSNAIDIVERGGADEN